MERRTPGFRDDDNEERMLRRLLESAPDDVRDEIAEDLIEEHQTDRRIVASRIRQFIWLATHTIAVLLLLRFTLDALGAQPDNIFVEFLQGLTWLFAFPFIGLFGPPIVSGQSSFDFGLLFGVLVYYLFAWIITQIVGFFATRTPTGTAAR